MYVFMPEEGEKDQSDQISKQEEENAAAADSTLHSVHTPFTKYYVKLFLPLYYLKNPLSHLLYCIPWTCQSVTFNILDCLLAINLNKTFAAKEIQEFILLRGSLWHFWGTNLFTFSV